MLIFSFKIFFLKLKLFSVFCPKTPLMLNMNRFTEKATSFDLIGIIKFINKLLFWVTMWLGKKGPILVGSDGILESSRKVILDHVKFPFFTFPNIVYVLLKVSSPVKSAQITCSSSTSSLALYKWVKHIWVWGPVAVEVYFKGSAWGWYPAFKTASYLHAIN